MSFRNFVVVLLGALTLACPQSRAGSKNDNTLRNESASKRTAVRNYLANELKVEPDQLAEYDLTLELEGRLERISPSKAHDPLWIKETLSKYFAENSRSALGEILRTMGRTEYNNTAALGPAGTGKSFMLDQIVAALSFGVVPDMLKGELELPGNPDAFKVIRDAFIGKVNVVVVNNHLLSQDPTEKGQAFSSEPMRMRKILTDLFNAANEQFWAGGRRTLFVFDEIQEMPELLKDSLKKILDKSGFHDPNDPMLRVKDRGYSMLLMTTPEEYQAFFKGNAPAERRAKKVFLKEPTEAEAFKIVRNKANVEWTNLYGLTISDEAIRYIIRNRKLLANPPQAMPGVVLTSANDLFLSPSEYIEGALELDVKAAKQYIMKQAGLTELWFEGPNGEPPMWDLAERVKKRVIGQDEVVDKIAERIKAWARLGFGSDVPVFVLGGPSGSGKDTLVKAFSIELFGHTSEHMTWGVGGAKDFKMESIFEGPPLGNHSDDKLPLLAEAMKRGPHNGFIVINEVKDTPTDQIEKLKLPLEKAMISPAGKDSRPRMLLFPMFMLGQWGEEIFDGMSDEKIAETYARMSQVDIERPFLAGKGNGVGGIPVAIMGRAKRTGGVYMLMPVPKRVYPKIVELYVKSMTEKLATNQSLKLTTSPELREYVALVAAKLGEGTRALEAITIDFTEGVISKAADQGLSIYGSDVSVTVEPAADWAQAKIVVRSGDREWKFAASEAYRGKSLCELLLTEALPTLPKTDN